MSVKISITYTCNRDGSQVTLVAGTGFSLPVGWGSVGASDASIRDNALCAKCLAEVTAKMIGMVFIKVPA